MRLLLFIISFMSCIGMILGETLFGTSDLYQQSCFVELFKLLGAYRNYCVPCHGLELP